MKVLVTGGAGFIGSHVVELYARKGNDVLILDDLSTGRMAWIQDLIGKHVAFDLCDIAHREHVCSALQAFQPDIICHLAAQPAISMSWYNPIWNAQTNEIGTLNLLEAVRNQTKDVKFILASTSAVYAETPKVLHESNPLAPTTPYGVSKLAAEYYVRILATNGIVLRLGNVYGPRQVPLGKNQVIPLMLRHLLYGEDFAITGDGWQKRDFVYVTDVADAFLLAAWAKPGTYNIAGGISVAVNLVARVLAQRYTRNDYEWKHTDEQDPRRDVSMDISAAGEKLVWCPTHSLREGLDLTAEWWNR